MRIRGTDLEMIAGVKETITYRKWLKTYDEDGKLLSRVRDYFPSDAIVEFTAKYNKDDTSPIILIQADIIDGNAVISLLEAHTLGLTDVSLLYDLFDKSIATSPICLIAPSNLEIVGSVNYTPQGS